MRFFNNLHQAHSKSKDKYCIYTCACTTGQLVISLRAIPLIKSGNKGIAEQIQKVWLINNLT